MLSVLSLVALGSLEQCLYVDLDPSTVEDCSGNVNAEQCNAVPDVMVGTCQASTDQTGAPIGIKATCSGSSVKWIFFAKTDCSDDTSATCVMFDLDPAKIVSSGCSMTYKIDECGTYMAMAGVGVHIKFKGTCPAEDEPVLDQANTGHCVQCDARMRRHLLFGSLPCCP